MQADDFSHCRPLSPGMPRARAQAAHGRRAGARRARAASANVASAAMGLFESCTAAIPYAPATAFLAKRARPSSTRGVRMARRHAVAILADGIGSTHGVTRAVEEIRSRGVEGFEIEVVGTDPAVDRRLAAVAEFEVPYYPGLQHRRAEPVGRRADDRRRRVRPDPRLLARPVGYRRRARQPRRSACRCSAATTPS